MTFTTFTGLNAIVIASATDTWFRTLKSMSDAFTTIGLPKTSDTGQFDWVAGTIPATGAFVYEIRTMSDSSQATDPVFIKIEYGRLDATNAYPRIRLSVGTGSDGAGNLTGAAPGSLTGYLSQTTGGTTWSVTSDGAGFAMIAGLPAGSGLYQTWLLVERARDQNGDPIPGQVMISQGCTGSPVSADYSTARAAMADLLLTRWYPLDGPPVYYWRDLSIATASLAMGSIYPFGVLMMPTPYAHGRSRLMVGVAKQDFLDAVILDLPRFSGDTPTPYKVFNLAVASIGLFGMSPSGVGATSSDSSVTFGQPCLYWA